MAKKIIAIVAAVILVIGISAGTTLLVGKKDVPVATKVEDGLSAYELAVQFGYEGTVQEWLESLEGKSAYQIAVDSGYKGTESEWLASLKATSDNTANIKNAQFNSKGELILTLSDNTSINLGVAVGTNGKDGAAGKNGADGKDGKDGQNGIPGKDGADGKDGVSISEASINSEGQLILTFTDGKSFNLDKVVGAKGEAQHAHAAMAGHNSLRHSRHTHSIGTQKTGCPDLSGRFILRAGEVHIDALPQENRQAVCRFTGNFPQRRGIDMGRIREAGAELIHIGTT